MISKILRRNDRYCIDTWVLMRNRKRESIPRVSLFGADFPDHSREEMLKIVDSMDCLGDGLLNRDKLLFLEVSTDSVVPLLLGLIPTDQQGLQIVLKL